MLDRIFPVRRARLLEGASLSLRVGRWLDARATGWGVLVLPIVLMIVALVVLGQ